MLPLRITVLYCGHDRGAIYNSYLNKYSNFPRLSYFTHMKVKSSNRRCNDVPANVTFVSYTANRIFRQTQFSSCTDVPANSTLFLYCTRQSDTILYSYTVCIFCRTDQRHSVSISELYTKFPLHILSSFNVFNIMLNSIFW